MALVISGVVHAGTLVLLIVGVWLTLQYLPTPLGWLGVLAAGIAITLRPRFGRVPKDHLRVDLGASPVFAGMLDELSAAAGTTRPNLVLVDIEFNMAFSRVGLRRRSMLVIGAPMWVALQPDQRLAVLAHELGHDVNHDVRRSIWVGGAIGALLAWCSYLHPGPWPAGAGPAEYTAYIVLGLPRLTLMWLAKQLARSLIALTARSHRAAELRADEIAVQIAGTGAMVRALDTAQLASSCMRAMKRARNGGNRDIFEVLVEHLRTLPPTEVERLRRLNARRGVAVDDSHPPTSDRITILDLRQPDQREPMGSTPLVSYRAAADNELAGVLEQAERQLYDRLAGLEP